MRKPDVPLPVIAHEIRHRNIFDYSRLDGPVATFLRGQVERINRTASKSVIQIGKDLVAAKHYLPYGQFLAWTVDELGMTARTAQAYMQVAQWASARGPSVANLPPSVLYVLSSPSAPEVVIRNTLRRLDNGERITASAIRQEIKAERMNGRDPEDVLVDPHVQGEEENDARTDNDGELKEVVAILQSRLSPSEFLRVQQIMLSSTVLADPELPKKITGAFGFGLSPQNSKELSK